MINIFTALNKNIEMKIILIFLLLIPVYALYPMSDTLLVPGQKIFQLNVFSNQNDADIYVDSVYAGKTPLAGYKLSEGLHTIKLINSGYKAGWRNDNPVKELLLISDTTLNINFRYYYSFKSDPFNAELIKDDTVFGKTPFGIFTEKELTGSIIFRKKNFSDLIFDLKNYSFETGANITLLPLKLNSGKTSDNYAYKNKSTQFKTDRNLIAIIGLGAAAVTGGVFSLNYKNKANENYDNYLATGNTASLNEANKYDTGFIISIVLMQMAVGGLIYFLFFD